MSKDIEDLLSEANAFFEVPSLLERALNEENTENQRELLQEVAKLDPDNLDIQTLLILMGEDYHQNYRKLAELEAKYFQSHRKQLKDGGYADIDNRPYFRLKAELIDYYFNQLMYAKAEAHAKAFLNLVPHDNLGVRYQLMALYAKTGNIKQSRTLFKKYDGFDDDRLLLPMIMAYVLNQDFDQANRLIKHLWEINPAITKFFQSTEEFNQYSVLYYANDLDTYAVNSAESLAVTFLDVMSLFTESDYLYQYIRAYLYKLDPKQITATERLFVNHAKARELENQGIFANIGARFVHPLLQNNLEALDDFAKITEKELLQIDGIGPATLKRLKENGVKFRSE
ncbi:hypothetical protein AWM75_08280 [Aerococcus urinaehominis]|uniref:Uncharacterized protein n=1 Tax=Aerococcus urinaehominis TaxID=128944 RepID=A0A0X8FNM0_9LACT|nr:hypothetical protein [Aerococcus urinaehominis]AMB99967.1 hypothetical protein AWM75_08280 [Aerococcus urinaehominis]SDM44889.1 hypothetical protein SAMN04487985_11716 [Aerococcus urinaehominis]